MRQWPILLSGFVGLGIGGIATYNRTELKPAHAPTAPTAVTTTAIPAMQSVTSVTNLYNSMCAKCHGERAQGGGGGTKSLNTKEKFLQKYDKIFFDTIKNGTEDTMEAYGTTLTDQQIWGLVVHIRELQASALRAEFGDPKPVNGVFPSTSHPYKVETVVDRGKGLQIPWSLDWLPDGTMLVANRPGALVKVKNGEVIATIEGTPKVYQNGQAGLMDVAVHPNYSKNGWIYLSFSDIGRDNPSQGFTKIVRGRLDGNKWVSQETIFEADQKHYSGGGVHFGSRIVFDGKGHIFFCSGERGRGPLAQDLSRPNGKIFRTFEDGTIPPDNPFAKSPNGELPQIWSYGHRNPQGLALDLSGQLWDTEHGPRGGDEVNKIEKAANYGWPLIAFSINYNDAPMETPWPKAGQNFKLPAFRWLPSIGACGLDVIKGNAFPKWKGDLVAGGLVGQNIDRIRMKNGEFVEREELIHNMGRVRDVVVGPDGNIYAALNDPDKIIRIVPASNR